MTRFILSSVIAVGAAFSTLPTFAGDWPQWRGPDRTGISQEKGWQANWPAEGPKVLWKAQVGLGFATFVVADGRVFTTGNAGNVDTVFCFDAASGKEIWKHSYPADVGAKFFEGGTTGTPTIDGKHLYQLSRWGDLFCFDAATGKVIWSKNIQTETEIRVPDWGFTGAPLVWEDLLILNVGLSGLAVEKATGKIVWKSADKEAGYSTPLPYQQNGKTYVTFGSGRSYVAVEPRTGKVVWEMPWTTSYGVNAADPIIHDGHLFISSGYNKGGALIKPTSSEPEVVWQSRDMRSQMNAAVLVDGYLYGVDGNLERSDSSLKCVEFLTGKVMWQEKAVAPGSITAADGKLIILGVTGELIVATPSPKGFQPISKAKVLSGKCWSVPVLANGRIYCRDSTGEVVCLDVRAK